MWSDKYHYYNIQKDRLLNEEFDTPRLRLFLTQIPELEQVSDYEFKNNGSFPFIRISLIRAKNPSSWSDNDHDALRTNLLSIVCAKRDEVTSQRIIAVLIQIASFLNWELVAEETDKGIEYFRVWQPRRGHS